MKAFPRDIEVSTLTERHIGIENELGVGDDDGGDLPDDVIDELNDSLLEYMDYDGGGREFITIPISLKSINQVRGSNKLCDYYNVLRDNTHVIEGGGTHIHISILDSDHKNMERNAVAISIAFFSQFQKIAGRQSTWASSQGQRNLTSLQNFLERCRIRYSGATPRTYNRGYYMITPTGHKTLEFRGPTGSNDRVEILAWIEFLSNVVKAANRENIGKLEFRDLLKGDRISAYVKTLNGWRGITEADACKKFNGSRLV